MNKKVYLASPFFNADQVAIRDEVKSLLDKYGFDVFSPGHDNLIPSDGTQDQLINGFRRNLSEIDKCDFMVAVGNGYDTGTIIEIGYAYKSKIPVVYFNNSNDGKTRNLMLAGASFMSAESYAELDLILSVIDNKKEYIEWGKYG